MSVCRARGIQVSQSTGSPAHSNTLSSCNMDQRGCIIPLLASTPCTAVSQTKNGHHYDYYMVTTLADWTPTKRQIPECRY